MTSERFVQQILGFNAVLKVGRPDARGCGLPGAGALACHNERRGNAVPQVGAVTCYMRLGRPVFTRRAPSSPHHACGLNGAFFLHTCTQLKLARAGGCARECGVGKACRSLQGWGKCNGQSEWTRTAILRGGSGKGLVFKKGVTSVLQALCLLGLMANFEELVMVRLKVSNV